MLFVECVSRALKNSLRHVMRRAVQVLGRDGRDFGIRGAFVQFLTQTVAVRKSSAFWRLIRAGVEERFGAVAPAVSDPATLLCIVRYY